MAAFSNYLETAILNLTLRNTAWTQAPANVYVALFTEATTDGTTTGGLAQKEVNNSATGYARIGVTFGVPSGGQCSNTGDVVFTTAAAGWGTVSHVAIMDDPGYGVGNVLYHGPLATSKTINTGDTFRFVAGTLIVGLD